MCNVICYVLCMVKCNVVCNITCKVLCNVIKCDATYTNQQWIVNEESDLASIKSDNNDATLGVTSSNKTTEQLATSSNQ